MPYSSLWPSTGRGHCVVLLRKTLYFHSAIHVSLHPARGGRGGRFGSSCRATAIFSRYLFRQTFFLHSTQVLLEKSFCKVSLPNSPCIHWGYQGLRYLYPLFLYRIFRDKSKTEINMLIFESTLLKIILSRSYPREIAQGFKLFISSKEYLSNCKNIRSPFPEVERQHPHPF